MGKKNETNTFTIQEYFSAQRKYTKKQERKEYRKEHAFDIANLVLAIIANILAIVANIIAFLALFK